MIGVLPVDDNPLAGDKMDGSSRAASANHQLQVFDLSQAAQSIRKAAHTPKLPIRTVKSYQTKIKSRLGLKDGIEPRCDSPLNEGPPLAASALHTAENKSTTDIGFATRLSAEEMPQQFQFLTEEMNSSFHLQFKPAATEQSPRSGRLFKWRPRNGMIRWVFPISPVNSNIPAGPPLKQLSLGCRLSALNP